MNENPTSPREDDAKDEGPSGVPADIERAELLKALNRLAALPDVPDSQAGPGEGSETKTDASHPEDIDENDDPSDIIEEGGSATENTAESADKAPDPGQHLNEEFEKKTPELADLPVEPDSNGAGTLENGQQSQDNGKTRGFLTGRTRSTKADRRRRDGLGGMRSIKEATSVTIESGMMKILSTKLLDVVDYRVVPLSSQLYAGGVVVDAGTISRHLAAALADMKGAHKWVYAAIPGYQAAMRRFDLPDVREIDPNEVIPREARRVLGVSVDNATLRWERLSGRSRIARWLVAAASETSYSAILSVLRGTGHKIRALELRPFALTRGVGHPTVISVFVSSDGCDVVVARDWEPHTYQSVYWETGSVSDNGELVRRVTEVVENTIDLHDLHNPEVALTPDVRMAVLGGETEQHTDLGMAVASHVGRDIVEARNFLNAPEDFPYRSMAVNVGLALWDV